ncbi:glutathione S-transferase N-terminal domain-containing protein [Actinomycetospora endophytica]|uniref:Glutathione S-transferase N-terminal domain-containing protein n=1 Tax=Actinomycetospora endophytica TaxID=2291215 RepID=A0ABS8PBY1_9PSEU|nr:glutathione S-transferase N-terminal domain-containing protein [Actinomycetospora endophytica]MCD2195762.1 glutathione S-transferase N-terminal domain-containing protein [Actinomycetospora endophytica]
MIDLYSFPSPNVRKIVIALEELGLAYRWVWTDIGAGDQFSDAFRAVNPNSKVPAIVDHDGPGGRPIALFESAAILLYLSEKAGGALLPTDPARRWDAMCWLAWQVANHGPMAGQAVHFLRYAPSQGVHDEYAQDRYGREIERLYAMLDERLADREYLVDEFSLADIACFPWVRLADGHGVDVSVHPHVAAWSARIAARPSARVRIPDPRKEDPTVSGWSAEQFATLFRSDAGKATR